jgi:hypothetical protein
MCLNNTGAATTHSLPPTFGIFFCFIFIYRVIPVHVQYMKNWTRPFFPQDSGRGTYKKIRFFFPSPTVRSEQKERGGGKIKKKLHFHAKDGQTLEFQVQRCETRQGQKKGPKGVKKKRGGGVVRKERK